MIELLLALILANPLCKVENREFLKWGNDRPGIVESDPVPKGKVWLIRAGGISTNDKVFPADYMLEIIHPVRSQGDACCWRIPVERTSAVNATPLLALSRPIALHEGERLGARTNGPAKMAIEFVYYQLPKECLLNEVED